MKICHLVQKLLALDTDGRRDGRSGDLYVHKETNKVAAHVATVSARDLKSAMCHDSCYLYVGGTAMTSLMQDILPIIP
jgi:hypothetical protein